MNQDAELVSVYRAMGLPEAEIIRGRLITEGIPAMLKYESLGIVCGLTVNGLGQVEVIVPSAHADQSRQIISGADLDYFNTDDSSSDE